MDAPRPSETRNPIKEDNVKFFLDTANLDEIEEAASWGVLAGVTTNPSLYAKIGGKLADFESHMKRICDMWAQTALSLQRLSP